MDEVLFRALPVFLMLSLALILAVMYYLEAQRAEALVARMNEDSAEARQMLAASGDAFPPLGQL